MIFLLQGTSAAGFSLSYCRDAAAGIILIPSEMKKLLFFLSLLFINICFSQAKSSSFETKLKVSLSNFSKSPPGCGTFKTAGIYSAVIKDHNRNIFGEEILFYVVCKADQYPVDDYSGDVYITINDVIDLTNLSQYNFSGLKDEELKYRIIYNLVSIQKNDNKL